MNYGYFMEGVNNIVEAPKNNIDHTQIIFEDLFEFMTPLRGDFYLEAEAIKTYEIRDKIYPHVEKVLKTPEGSKAFKKCVERYIDQNSEKLHEPCPINLIPFTDTTKQEFYNLFGVNESEIKVVINNMLKLVSDKAQFKLIKQNPIFTIFYCCVRYYTIKKDQVGINTSLIIYALATYPSIFSKYFKYGANEGVMRYTADNLTNKFTIKRKGHVFGALTESIMGSYSFLKPYFIDGNDREVVRFIQRIRNDQNSMIKKIANEYHKNYKAGRTVQTELDSYDGNTVIVDNLNNTSVVEDASRKIVMAIITNGVNLRLAETAAKWSNISIIDLRLYLTQICSKKYVESLNRFIESVLFIYLYDEHHTPNEIKSKVFLSFAIELFRRTNSGNDNIRTIKVCLENWAEDTGVHERFRREATRVGYKKGIFWYLMLCIQLYT